MPTNYNQLALVESVVKRAVDDMNNPKERVICLSWLFGGDCEAWLNMANYNPHVIEQTLTRLIPQANLTDSEVCQLWVTASTYHRSISVKVLSNLVKCVLINKGLCTDEQNK